MNDEFKAEVWIAPVWITAAGALLGAGAHFANVLPDLEDDARTGVRGLPHRIGRVGSLVLTWVTLLAAALSLAFIVGLIKLSLFKHDVLLMTVNFVDLMIIDADTFTFLMKIFPQLGAKVAIVCTLGLAALMAIWYFDPMRVRRRVALAGAGLSFAALIGLSLTIPNDPWDEFYAENYVSKFARSGVTASEATSRSTLLVSRKGMRLGPVTGTMLAFTPHSLARSLATSAS